MTLRECEVVVEPDEAGGSAWTVISIASESAKRLHPSFLFSDMITSLSFLAAGGPHASRGCC